MIEILSAPSTPANSGGSWTQYYEIIDGSTPALTPGQSVSFSSDGVSYAPGSNPWAQPVRYNDTTFSITVPSSSGYIWSGCYRFFWQVPVANAGQLALTYAVSDPSLQHNYEYTVVGTSWGHSQIIGDFMVRLNFDANTVIYFAIVNPAANNQTINLLSSGAGNVDVATSLLIQYLQ